MPASQVSSFQNSDCSSPSRRGRVNFHRETGYFEAKCWKRFEIVQLFNVAIADFPSRFMPFPDHAGVTLSSEPFRRVYERCIPAPCICTSYPHSLLEKVQSCISANPAPPRHVVIFPVAVAGGSINHNNV